MGSPGKGRTWRPLGRNEVLEDLERDLGQAKVPGHRRCSVQGLLLGDCEMEKVDGSAYCYYHDKVQRDLITEFREKNSGLGWVDVNPRAWYPVWPLPREGYVLLVENAKVA